MRTNRAVKIGKPLYAKSISEYNQKQRAGVVQWQYRTFPSFGRGFDSHRPLQILRNSSSKFTSHIPDRTLKNPLSKDALQTFDARTKQRVGVADKTVMRQQFNSINVWEQERSGFRDGSRMSM